MYTKKVIENFINPKNMGKLENANAIGQAGNAKCGDIMKIYLLIEDNIIKDIKFETFGCAAAIATSSVTTELAKGKTINDVLKITNKMVVETLEGLPTNKIHCSVLAEEALKNALLNYYQNNNKIKAPSELFIKQKTNKTSCKCCCDVENCNKK